MTSTNSVLAQQVEDKMCLLKAAVEADPRAHSRPSGVKHLASLLGLKGRSNEVTMCIGQSALAQRNLEAAQQSCVQLIRREYVASWRLCANVMKAGGDEVGSADTHIMLLSFAAQYARGKKVILLPPLLLMLMLLRCILCLCCQHKLAIGLSHAPGSKLTHGSPRCVSDFACRSITHLCLSPQLYALIRTSFRCSPALQL